MEEVGNERCTKEEEDVEDEADTDVEPEDGIVIVVGGIAFVGQSSNETTIL